MGKIEIDFQNACRKAEEMNEIAEKLHQLADVKIPEELNRIAGSWKGDNAGILCGKVDSLDKKLQDQAKKAQTCADSIERIAENLRDAERMIQNLFGRQRTR